MTIHQGKQNGPLPSPTRAKHFKSPWEKGSVRRRWTRIMYLVIVLFVLTMALVNPQPAFTDFREVSARLLMLLVGLLALPSLYILARHLGASRTTSVWAMALLGGNIAWLLALRHGELVTVLPLAVSLSALFYYQLLGGHTRAWVGLGLCVVLAGFCSVPAGLGLLAGLVLHAACWARGRNVLWQLGWAALLITAGAGAVCWIVPLAGRAFSGAFLPGLLRDVSAMNTWLLPLLALPLLLWALWHDPAAPWHASRVVTLLAFPLLAGLLIAGCCRRGDDVPALLGMAPLAALWLAMGLARLQARTPAWVWAPVALILVTTTLPQALLGWGQRTSPHFASILLARRHTPPAGLLVPLYAYVEQELAGEGLRVSE